MKKGSERGKGDSWNCYSKFIPIPPCPSLWLTGFHRSPDIEIYENNRASIGGWGLGNLHEEDAMKKHIMEDEGDKLDWDQAQSVVERMVGMKVSEN